VVSATDPYDRNLGFLGRSRCFSSKQLLSCTHEDEWTHCFSENLVGPRIEPEPLDLFSENMVALEIEPGPLNL
jgi:hypothetical protein